MGLSAAPKSRGADLPDLADVFNKGPSKSAFNTTKSSTPNIKPIQPPLSKPVTSNSLAFTPDSPKTNSSKGNAKKWDDDDELDALIDG